MVNIIQNPAYGGSVDRTGQDIGSSLQNIASAFAPKQVDIQGQLAVQNYKDKLAAQQVVGGLASRYSDASQDYAQDAPDYSTPQPAPTITMGDPASVARAFMILGADPGKAIQQMSALQGGISAPGVGLGATMDDKYASTPEGIASAANRTASLEPYVYADRSGTPQVTNKAVAAGGALPGGGTPLISTDQQKAVELGRLLFGQPSTLVPQGAAANPNAPIAVPGYSGTFTRGQANDADGAPSQAEWDAANAGGKPGAAPVATADQRIILGLDKPPAEASKKEFKEIGQDVAGGKQYGTFDPSTGSVTPYKSAGGGAMGAQIQQLEMPNADAGMGDKTPYAPLPPDQQAKLIQVDPAIRGTVESILQGRSGLPKITAGRGNQLALAISESVYSVNPHFDANTNQNQLSARKAFNAGGSNNTPGQLILNSDSALDHFEPLVRASDALPNYGSVVGGAIYGLERGTGGHFGGDYQNKIADLQSAATPASAETMKYLAGTTGGGEGERKNLIESFSDTGGTPQSRRASVRNYVDDMLAKKAELQNQWHSAMGANAPDFPVISNTARASVERMGFGNLLEKYGLSGGKPLGATTTQPQGAQPTAPPAQPGGSQIRTYNPATGALE